MFILSSAESAVTANYTFIDAVKIFFDKETVFTLLNLFVAAFSAYCAWKANKKSDEAHNLYNNIKMICENNFIINNTVENIVNDDAAIEKIAIAVTNRKLNEYTKTGHPPIKIKNHNGQEAQTKELVFIRK